MQFKEIEDMKIFEADFGLIKNGAAYRVMIKAT